MNKVYILEETVEWRGERSSRSSIEGVFSSVEGAKNYWQSPESFNNPRNADKDLRAKFLKYFIEKEWGGISEFSYDDVSYSISIEEFEVMP